jgi:hypothetical protein
MKKLLIFILLTIVLFPKPVNAIESFFVGFENNVDFQWGLDGGGSYMLFGVYHTNQSGACVAGCYCNNGDRQSYWSRGSWPACLYPTVMLFEKNSTIVHGGVQSAKISVLDTSKESTRRIEILHDWNPETDFNITSEEWFYFPSTVNPINGWITFHRIIYERMWDQNKAVDFQQFQISLSAITDGRSLENGKQIFVLDLGKGDIDNNNDGVEETWPYMQADIYSNYDSSIIVPSSWLTKKSIYVPFDRWLKVKSEVFRNLTDFNNGYVKVWIDDDLIWDVHGTRTVGINPHIINSLDVLPPEPQAYLCTGLGLYTDLNSGPKQIFVDDIIMSSTQNEFTCNCAGWKNQDCGAGGCASNQQYQTRTCSPAGCDITSQCIYNASCAQTSTTITSNAVPNPVTQNQNTTLYCDYRNATSNTEILNANVKFGISGSNYTASYNSTNNRYEYRYNSTTAGTQTIYCYASATNFQSNSISFSLSTTPSFTVISGRLIDNSSNPIQAKVIVYQQGTSTIVATNQTSNGYYSLSVTPNIYDLQFNISNFYIKLTSINVISNLNNVINYVNYDSSKLSFISSRDEQDFQILSSNPNRVLLNSSEIASFSLPLNNNTYYYSSGIVYLKVTPDLKSDCIYQCCKAETRYRDKACSSGYYCSNRMCYPKQPCPVDGWKCCLNEEMYLDYLCPSGQTCSNHVCISTVNKTFGKTNIGSTSTPCYVGDTHLGRFTLNEDGAVTKITAYISGAWGNPATVRAGIYSDSAGSPSRVKGTTGDTVVSATAGWYNFTFSTPLSLTAGTYHIGFYSGDHDMVCYYNTGSTGQYNYKNWRNFGDPYPGGSTQNWDISVYATYTTG